MKKLKLLTLLPALCLSSCSGSSYYGTYEFRLGKTDGSHIGLSVELLEQEDENHKEDGMRKMLISADLGSEFSIESIAEQITDDPAEQAFIEEIIKLLSIDTKNKIDAYYTVTDLVDSKYGNRVKMGSDYIQEIVKKTYPELADLFGGLATPNIVEMVACTYVNKKQFTIQIPVSLPDLQLQLAWYGTFVDPNNANLIVDLDKELLPGLTGDERFGSHPEVVTDRKGEVIKSEVETMNETFEYEFSHMYLYNEEKEAIGSFVVKTDEKSERKVLYFKPFKELPTVIEGTLSYKIIGEEIQKPIKFTYAPQSHEVTGITYNGKSGYDEGFTDVNGNEFLFSKFYKAPFVFRDYHDVKVGLAKI